MAPPGFNMKITPIPSNAGTFTLSHTAYSPALFAACRAIPGCTRAGSKAIQGSADAIECAIQYLVEEKGLREDCFEGRELLAPQVIDRFRYGADERLRQYQIDAVHFLKDQKRAILADDMGLGKTAVGISASISFITTKRVLIVCPSYVRGVWHNSHDGGELSKWANAGGPLNAYNTVFECKGTKPNNPLAAYEFVVCHYDILHAWADVIQKWAPEIVIFDECHFLMNPESRRTKAARSVSEKAEYVWGLSGTPMTNRPKDLWGVLSTICPQRFGDNFFPFGLRYCGAYKEQVTPDKTVWKFDGSSNLTELNARLKHFMLRRTKTDVALELPAKTRQVIRCDVGGPKRKAVEAIIPEKGAALRASLAAAADAKLEAHVLPLIQSHLEAGARVVVATYRKAVAEYIAKTCGGAFIHSGVSMARREAIIHELRQRDGASLLVGTIDSTSTGIDLSYADVGICAELTYEPHELLQWEARLHRYGQKNLVLIQYPIAIGTTDELIADVVISKLSVLEESMGGFAETGLRNSFSGTEEDIMNELYKGLGL